jgi:hypothetical protein
MDPHTGFVSRINTIDSPFIIKRNDSASKLDQITVGSPQRADVPSLKNQILGAGRPLPAKARNFTAFEPPRKSILKERGSCNIELTRTGTMRPSCQTFITGGCNTLKAQFTIAGSGFQSPISPEKPTPKALDRLNIGSISKVHEALPDTETQVLKETDFITKPRVNVIDHKHIGKNLGPAMIVVSKPSPSAMLSRKASIAESGRGSFADNVGPGRQSGTPESGIGSDHLGGKLGTVGPMLSVFGQKRPFVLENDDFRLGPRQSFRGEVGFEFSSLMPSAYSSRGILDQDERKKGLKSLGKHIEKSKALRYQRLKIKKCSGKHGKVSEKQQRRAFYFRY